jgi:hypothetical protein
MLSHYDSETTHNASQTVLFHFRPNKHADDSARLFPGVVPAMHSAALDNYVPGAKIGLRAVVEFEDTAPRDHIQHVHRCRAMHARIVWEHGRQQTRKQALDFGGGGLWVSLRRRRAVRSENKVDKAKSADRQS